MDEDHKWRPQELYRFPTTATDSMPHRLPRNYCNRFDAAFVTRNEKSVRICKIIYFTSYLLFRNFYIPSGSAMQAPGVVPSLSTMTSRQDLFDRSVNVEEATDELHKIGDKRVPYRSMGCLEKVRFVKFNKLLYLSIQHGKTWEPEFYHHYKHVFCKVLT